MALLRRELGPEDASDLAALRLALLCDVNAVSPPPPAWHAYDPAEQHLERHLGRRLIFMRLNRPECPRTATCSNNAPI
jgi:hypothetical protein